MDLPSEYYTSGIKKGSFKIKKGTAIKVIVRGENITDNRIFTNVRKLEKFCVLINRYYRPFKIRMKTIKLN